MNKLRQYLWDLDALDRCSLGHSYLHRIDPLAKLLTTLAFILIVISFPKYEISTLLPFFMFPVFLISAGGLPYYFILKKILLLLPFLMCVGIWNPFLDTPVRMYLGEWPISGGWLSFTSLLLRLLLTVSASLCLLATTGIHELGQALLRLRVPKVFVIQLLLLYRYIFLLTEEAERITRARDMRSTDQARMSLNSYINSLGHWLLRSSDRAERVYKAMLCRGFDGQFLRTQTSSLAVKDFAYIGICCALFTSFRYHNFPQALGEALTRSLPS